MSTSIHNGALAEFDHGFDVGNRLIHPESAGFYHAVHQRIELVPKIARRPLATRHLTHAWDYAARDFASDDRNRVKAARAPRYQPMFN